MCSDSLLPFAVFSLETPGHAENGEDQNISKGRLMHLTIKARTQSKLAGQVTLDWHETERLRFLIARNTSSDLKTYRLSANALREQQEDWSKQVSKHVVRYTTDYVGELIV